MGICLIFTVCIIPGSRIASREQYQMTFEPVQSPLSLFASLSVLELGTSGHARLFHSRCHAVTTLLQWDRAAQKFTQMQTAR